MKTDQIAPASILHSPILVVEQDPVLRTSIATLLRKEHYVVLAVSDEMMALEIVQDNPVSLIIFGLGESLSQREARYQTIRSLSQTISVPVVLVVPRERDISAIERQGLQITDYLVKPLIWEEVQACVHTIMRHRRKGGRGPRQRSTRTVPLRENVFPPSKNMRVSISGLDIDLAQRTVSRYGQMLPIRSKLLFDLLSYFVQHQGIALSREQLLMHVWGYEQQQLAACNAHTVSVHVHWLREILGDDPDHPQWIKTVRGFGYRFQA